MCIRDRLGDLLRDAIQNIHAEITEFEIDDLEEEDEDLSRCV